MQLYAFTYFINNALIIKELRQDKEIEQSIEHYKSNTYKKQTKIKCVEKAFFSL